MCVCSYVRESALTLDRLSRIAISGTRAGHAPSLSARYRHSSDPDVYLSSTHLSPCLSPCQPEFCCAPVRPFTLRYERG